MKWLKLFEAIEFDDKEWDEVEPDYDSNLEKEFEEIVDYFLEISDQHPDIRFRYKNSAIKLYDIISLLNNIKSPIRKMSNWKINSIEPNWSGNQNGWIKISFFKK